METLRIPDRWLQGATMMEQLRTGCSFREALSRSIAAWQEQEALEAQYYRERGEQVTRPTE
jgi:hypothetical protein